MTNNKRVLLSWVARNNDPYEKDREQQYKIIDGQRVVGPTMNLLFSPESDYSGTIQDVFLLFREQNGKSKHCATRGDERWVFDELQREIYARDNSIRVTHARWDHNDPTEHEAIFVFIKSIFAKVRKKFPGQEIVIHISPGTPSMQTIWVLMAEAGFLSSPFKIVKSYRPRERNGRPVVIPVKINIDTYYKRYQQLPKRVGASEKTAFHWDPQHFVSPRLRNLFGLARRYAMLRVPVLILGERGTGKTTLATWIRSSSSFRCAENDSDWPILACGQYLPETMRAELFGYVKGAFTGADSNKDGLLLKANNDTLFLDEIGDISKDLQRLLIKAIEEKRFQPIGSGESKESNFRLVTATNQPLKILQKKLDSDFLDRISYFRLEMPSLREIPEDIPWLWKNVYEEAALRAGVTQSRLRLSSKYHIKIASILQRNKLSGNIRDLYLFAYNLIACMVDQLDPSTPEEAIEFAKKQLLDTPIDACGYNSQANQVAMRFSESASLDSLLPPGTLLDYPALEGSLKSYLAYELFRIAKERGVPIESICTLTRRTLNNWRS